MRLDNTHSLLDYLEGEHQNTNLDVDFIEKNVETDLDGIRAELQEIDNQIKDESGGEMGADGADDGMFAHNDPTKGDK